MKKLATILSSKGLGIFSIFVLIGGLIGHFLDDARSLPADFHTGDVVRLLAYDLIKALKLFSLSLPEAGTTENWLLVASRLAGSLVAAAAVFKVIGAIFRQDVAAFIVSFFRHHTVLLGFGSRNAHFMNAASGFNAGKRRIILDSDPAKAKAASAQSKALFFQTDLSIAGAARPANLRRAGLVLIGTGSDERNLSLARSVLKARRGAAEPGCIVLTIDDAGLAERCARDPNVSRPANGDELMVFNVPSLTARALLRRTPFSDLALAAGQKQVHLIIVGFSETAQEIIVQFLRISACAGLERPRIDIVTPDRRAARAQLLERAPNLAYTIRQSDRTPDEHAPLVWAIELYIHEADPIDLCHDEALQAAVYTQTEPTAVIVATQDTTENVKIGLAFKQVMRVSGRHAAPAYVHVPSRTSLESLLTVYDGGSPRPKSGPLADIRGTGRPVEAIEPFGALEDICSLEALAGTRERRARELHLAYLERRGQSPADASPDDPASRPWESLAETYRQASRRAVDHLPVKLLSVGAQKWWDTAKLEPLAAAVDDPERLEELARLEHDSWRIDRELDGWRYAPQRDNERLLHPDLVDYRALGERSKSYDREIVTAIATSRTPPVAET